MFLTLLALALLFQGKRGIFETTEGRYTSVASEMLRTNDWLAPHLNDEQSHFTKPPLTYWLLASSTRVFGRTEFAARLPGAVAFLLTVLVVGYGGRYFSPQKPLLPAIIYATFLFPATVSNVIATDNFLTLAETAAMVAFAAHFFGPGRQGGTLALTAGWSLMGCAFMTKGYPALLPLLAAATWYAMRARHAEGRAFWMPAGLVLFTLIGLSWYAVVIVRQPALLGYFFGDELVGRISGLQHRNPEWYRGFTVYGPVLLFGTLPWTLCTARGIACTFSGCLRNREIAKADRSVSRNPDWFLLLWLLVPLIVFMLVRSRLQLYVQPLFAPIAFMTARHWRGSRLFKTRIVVAVTAVLALRFVGGLLPSANDSRPIASRLVALANAAPHEIVFVESRPYRGVAFYLNAEVEEVSMSGETGESLRIDSLQKKVGSFEEGRLWVVPVRSGRQFEQVVHSHGVSDIVMQGTIHGGQNYLVFSLH